MSEYQVIWSGITLESSGYGRISREFALALDSIGVDVKFIPYANPNGRVVELSPRLKELSEKPIATNKKTIVVNCIQPQQVDIESQREQFDYIVCNTVWETSVAPEVWNNLNMFDAVIVPCSQNIEAVRNRGLQLPVHVVPYGCDNDDFNPDNKPFSLDNDDSRFTFVSIFEWGYRKAPDVLLKAYWSEFSKDDNVRLVIKTYAGNLVCDNRNLIDLIAHYKQIHGFDNNTAPLYLSTSKFNDVQLKGMYTMADTFVLVSRGEGFGMPYFEALNSCTPIIAPKWGGGRADLLKEDFAYFVDYTMVQAKLHDETGLIREMHGLFSPDMQWAEPSIDSLRKQMRYAYESREETMQKGIAGREALKDLTWESAGKLMKATLEEVMREDK